METERVPKTTTTTTSSVGVHNIEYWSGGFQKILKSGLLSDLVVSMVGSDVEYKLHKVILVRSSLYFRKLLLGGFKEEGSNRVQISNINQFESLLHYMYTGEISISPNNVADILDGADILAIDGLTQYVSDVVQSQLDANKHLIFSYFNRGEETRLACVEYIHQNFSDLVRFGCFDKLTVDVMPADMLANILTDDALCALPEDDVVRAVSNYINNNRSVLTGDQIKALLTAPRYLYVKTETLLKMHLQYKDFLPSYFQDVLVVKMCQQTELKIPSELITQKPRGGFGLHLIQPSTPTDCKGLFYWLGTNRNTEPWQNPVTKGFVGVTCSSCWGGVAAPDPSVCSPVTEPNHVFFWTNNEVRGWIQFDVDPKSINSIRFTPTHYVYGFQTNMWMPRNWEFVASNDGSTWDVLRDHANDQTITGGNHYLFEVSGATTSYRFFRLRVTGLDSSGTNYLGLSAFDMFGSVTRD